MDDDELELSSVETLADVCSPRCSLVDEVELSPLLFFFDVVVSGFLPSSWRR